MNRKLIVSAVLGVFVFGAASTAVAQKPDAATVRENLKKMAAALKKVHEAAAKKAREDAAKAREAALNKALNEPLGDPENSCEPPAAAKPAGAKKEEPKKKGKGDCAAELEQWGGACYPPCKAGYRIRKGDGSICEKACPPGFNDIGAYCERGPHKTWKSCNQATGQDCKGTPLFYYAKCPSPLKAATGVWCEKDDYRRTLNVTEGAKKAGEVFKQIAMGVACAATGGLACLIKGLAEKIAMFADPNARKKFFCELEKDMRTVVRAFIGVLNMKELTADKLGFALDRTFKDNLWAFNNIMKKLSPPITGIDVVDNYIHLPAAAGISALLLPHAVVMGLTHFGIKKLMGVLIPEFIFAVGDISGKVKEELNKFNDPGVKAIKVIIDAIKSIAPNALGIMSQMMEPKAKERMQAVVDKMLNITEKIKEAQDKAIEAAMTAAARGGKADTAAIDGILDEDIIKKNPLVAAEAIQTVVTEMVHSAIEGPLNKLIAMLAGMLGKVMEIPRNAIVASVGSIPFGGGVLAGLINFAMGLVADYIFGIVTSELVNVANSQVDEVLTEAFDSLKAKMTGTSPKAQKNAAKFAGFLAFAQDMLGDMTKGLKATKDALKKSLQANIVGGVVSLAGAIVPQILGALKVPAPVKALVTKIFARAGDVASALTSKPIVVKDVVASVVNVGAVIGDYLLGMIPDAALRKMLLHAHAAVVAALQDVSAIAKSPMGLLAGLGETVGEYVKELLGRAMSHVSVAPERGLVMRAIDTLLDLLKDPESLFPKGKAPNAAAIVEKVVDLAEPYALERLRALVLGTGIESIVELGVKAVFGAAGPLRNGEKFFAGLQKLFSEKGTAILGEALAALSSFVSRQLGRVAGGQMPAAAIEGLLKALGNALQSPGGIAALAKGGAESILRMGADALKASLRPSLQRMRARRRAIQASRFFAPSGSLLPRCYKI